MNILDYIKKDLNDKRLSHAYLLEMNDTKTNNDLIIEILNVIMKQYQNTYEYFSGDINIKIIESENENIKKEQISNLMADFNKKSMNERPLIYVIKNADKMNKHAANSILKFLEEPEENIIAILTTENTELVIDTIKSRCRIYTQPEQENLNTTDLIELYIRNIEQNESVKEIIEKTIETKEQAINFFIEYENYLANNIRTNTKKITDSIKIVFKYKNRIRSNANLKLLFEAFDIEIKRVYSDDK